MGSFFTKQSNQEAMYKLGDAPQAEIDWRGNGDWRACTRITRTCMCEVSGFKGKFTGHQDILGKGQTKKESKQKCRRFAFLQTRT